MKSKVKENGKYIIPSWCRDACQNSGRIGCVLECAGERKARYFVPDPDVTLEDIAPFPDHEWFINSTPQERQAIAGLYLSKITEAITGVPQDEERDRLKKELEAASNERLLEIVTEVLDDGNGNDIYRAGGGGVPEDKQVETVSPDPAGENAAHKDR